MRDGCQVLESREWHGLREDEARARRDGDRVLREFQGRLEGRKARLRNGERPILHRRRRCRRPRRRRLLRDGETVG